MSNGEVCCLLQVCCPPESRKKVAVDHLVSDAGLTPEAAASAFQWFDERFDFAPKGHITPLIEHIAALARQHPKGND